MNYEYYLQLHAQVALQCNLLQVYIYETWEQQQSLSRWSIHILGGKIDHSSSKPY